MRSGLLVLAAADIVRGLASTSPDILKPRLDNGLGETPALGWNSWVLKYSFRRILTTC
jgi:hypothetical protein